ncbi:hypothetical protein S7711_09755 [Stachybotrys chartarum IBT 7711]|uniref:Uncharacterized protein n=1 Tax=Stachybotrys chartarum (strain CBS 109288 / IBT 7711) TaxID=1280523 RepID=A0A084B2V7_STACB|nr:hypothetical protein S7711_09755 [Stachybotrys chartarum IBT 7711]
MRYLIESNEWRLVCDLGRLFGQRKASHRVQPLGRHEPVYYPAVEHIEVELRRLLLYQDIPQSLNDAEFKAFQATLERICILLEDLVSEHLSASSSTGATSYPRLRALLTLLASAAEPVDLIHGPNTTLFTLPRNSNELDRCRRVVTECCQALSKLLTPPAPEPATQPLLKQRKKHKDTWKKARIRKQATLALETLFRHFKCGTAHEVLLRLTEDTDQDAVLPTLQMMLPRCPELESWLEARCESLHLYVLPYSVHLAAGLFSLNLFRNEASILPILDICTGLPGRPSQEAALVLFMEECALFGAWGDSKFPVAQPSRESLSQLIAKGVFEPPSRNINAVLNGLSATRFSTREKQALAIKLGFCLMDFFDAEVDSKHIYFLDSSRKESPPYLAFKSKLPATSNPYNFRMGHPHPVLLSFAKLLLEIYCGQAIDLDISSDDRQIRDAWTKLLDVVETLEKDKQDSSLQAIRGCLLVHQEIAKALGSRDIDAEDADKKIRRKLYKEVICKLQLGLAESTPRGKRRRSESPPPSDRSDSSRVIGPSDIPSRSVGSDFDLAHRKRQRTTDLINRLPETNGNGGHHTIGRQSPSADTKVSRPTSRDEFEIAIVCALPVEYNAVSLLVDEFWDEESGSAYGKAPGDENWYSTGRIGRVNVVLVLCDMGKVNAAKSTANMTSSYSRLKFILVTGICGGAPQTKAGQELLLGDVVISNSVIQHDFGKRFPDRFAMKDGHRDILARPGDNVRNLVALIDTDLQRKAVEKRTADLLSQLQQKGADYQYPGAGKDRLFEASFHHKHRAPPPTKDPCLCHNSDAACEDSREMLCETLGCPDNDKHLVPRKRLETKQCMERAGRPRDAQSPSIFVGRFASGDTVLKSAEGRDEMADKYGIMAFEMEGAGAWDATRCIVIKGVCDYADSHKNKSWQAFASATAASAVRALLERYMQDYTS